MGELIVLPAYPIDFAIRGNTLCLLLMYKIEMKKLIHDDFCIFCATLSGASDGFRCMNAEGQILLTLDLFLAIAAYVTSLFDNNMARTATEIILIYVIISFLLIVVFSEKFIDQIERERVLKNEQGEIIETVGVEDLRILPAIGAFQVILLFAWFIWMRCAEPAVDLATYVSLLLSVASALYMVISYIGGKEPLRSLPYSYILILVLAGAVDLTSMMWILLRPLFEENKYIADIMTDLLSLLCLSIGLYQNMKYRRKVEQKENADND